MNDQSFSRMTAEAGFEKVRRHEQAISAATEREERGAAIDAKTTRLRELRRDKERADKTEPVSSPPAPRRKLHGQPVIVA
jgi:hypothetical protein